MIKQKGKQEYVEKTLSILNSKLKETVVICKLPDNLQTKEIPLTREKKKKKMNNL